MRRDNVLIYIIQTKTYLLAAFLCAITLAAHISFARMPNVRLLPHTITRDVQHPQNDVFDITFTNTTDAAFVFRKANFDCKCLTIKQYMLNGKKSAPMNVSLQTGDVFSITLSINGAYYMSPTYVPVYFYFSGIAPAVQIAKIQANVHSDVVASPNTVAAVIPEGFTGCINRISITKPDTIKITNITCESDALRTQYSPEKATIELYGKEISDWITNTWLTLHLTGSKQHMARLYISEIVTVPDIVAMPVAMYFGVVNSAGKIQGKEVQLRTRTGIPWKILGTHVKGKNANAVKTRILPQSNDTINVVWAILDGTLKPGALDTEIILTTDHPYSRTVTVPVKGQVISQSPHAKKKQ